MRRKSFKSRKKKLFNMKKETKETLTFISLLLGIFLIWSGFNNYTTNGKTVESSVIIYVIAGILLLAYAYSLQKG